MDTKQASAKWKISTRRVGLLCQEGKIKGAYGPYFLRLKTPITTMIGIHGTCYPELIGTRTSSGCIRIHNDVMLKLVKLVKIGTPVTIEKDK